MRSLKLLLDRYRVTRTEGAELIFEPAEMTLEPLGDRMRKLLDIPAVMTLRWGRGVRQSRTYLLSWQDLENIGDWAREMRKERS